MQIRQNYHIHQYIYIFASFDPPPTWKNHTDFTASTTASPKKRAHTHNTFEAWLCRPWAQNGLS